ncbi:MAG: methylmalonyl-CoA mutase [Thermoleophilia bacterium]|nr:methylmalonyl-CoA mutase [Thermoleophilia bacterium]
MVTVATTAVYGCLPTRVRLLCCLVSEDNVTTESGIPVEPFYTGAGDSAEIAAPGEFPYTRGVRPDGYRRRAWTMRQYAGFASAEETNERFKLLLERGQTGLSTAFDLPTQLGLDSDDPRSLGEVGRTGVAIDSVEDMERLFKGIPLADVSTSMTINAPASVLLLLYELTGERQGVAPEQLSGTIQNDILKEYAARGNYIYPPRPSMRLTVDTIRYAQARLPRFNTISISGYHIREAGSTAVQELAFTLANGLAYVQAAVDGGLDVDAFAPRLSFFFNAHNDVFQEVAKFRAARRMWAGFMRDRFGAKDERSLMLRFHAQTGGSTLTAQQPEVNLVRVALQAFSAAAGGAQSLHTNGFDEALALPTEHAATLALRTQQVLLHESGVPATADPFGGSWYVEQLTDDLEARAQELIDEIDRKGGSVVAIEEGFIQDQIEDSSYRSQMRLERGDDIVVGVNKYRNDEEPVVPIHRLDANLEQEQVARTQALRAARDSGAVESALADVRAAADTPDRNMLEPMRVALAAHATVGEVCGVLRKVWGTHDR